MGSKLIASVLVALTISGCSIFQAKPREVEIVTVPVKIDIAQPTLPRPINLKEPKWYVVSDRVIPNPCRRPAENEPRDCDLGKENDWPEGYTYFDRFQDDIKKLHNGDIVFVAMTVDDYELMSYNMQEVKRYINQLGEVIVYYRNVTIGDQEGAGVELRVENENE